MQQHYDWSEDVVRIQQLMPDINEAFNRRDYPTAHELAVVVAAAARYLAQTAKVLSDAK